MQGIYKIQNRVNGKYYVGSSSNVKKRWREHKGMLEKGKHLNNHLQNTWNKWGKETFEFKLVENIEDKKNLQLVEQEYLDAGFELGLLYNISRLAAGGSVAGWHHTKEALAKISKASSGKNNPMYGKTGADSPNYGKKNPEHSKRISGAGNYWFGVTGEDHPLYGRRLTEEAIARMSGENNGMFGKHHSEESKAKMSKAKGKAAYPAFANVITKEFIPAGYNLKKLCRERNVNYNTFLYLRDNKLQQSKSGWRLAKDEWELATSDDFRESHAKPYPAFFNIQTRALIPAGHNLAKLCRKQNLDYGMFQDLRRGNTKQSMDGWTLA